MAKKTLKWNKAGFAKLRNEPALRDLSADLAREVAREASRIGGRDLPVLDGDSLDRSGYKVTELLLQDSRAAASVMAIGAARNENRKDSTLLRGLSKVARETK